MGFFMRAIHPYWRGLVNDLGEEIEDYQDAYEMYGYGWLDCKKHILDIIHSESGDGQSEMINVNYLLERINDE